MPADLLSPVAAGTAAEAATSGEAWLRALIDAEAALARAQVRLGLIPDGVAEAVAGARPDLGELAERARASGNPVVPLVAELRKVAGEHVHHGATSQDIMDTAAMLVASRTRELILGDLGRVLAGTADIATPLDYAETLARGIGGAELVVVPEAAHLANLERPEPVTDAIVRHLERTLQ